MNIKEKINQINQNETDKITKIERNFQEKKIKVKKIFDDLKIGDIFEEIKNKLWETGNITSYTDNSTSRNSLHYSIKLSAQWPFYSPSQLFSDGEDGVVRSEPGVFMHGPNISFSLDYDSSFDKIITNIYTDKFIKISHYNEESKLDLDSSSRYEIPSIFTWEHDGLKLSDFDEKRKDDYYDTFIGFCAGQDKIGVYPLSKLIKIDRLEIIQKINSGELLMKNVNNDFFSEDEMKFINPPQIKTETPKKRSFLDRLLGP